jgi:hypothetical protein
MKVNLVLPGEVRDQLLAQGRGGDAVGVGLRGEGGRGGAGARVTLRVGSGPLGKRRRHEGRARVGLGEEP